VFTESDTVTSGDGKKQISGCRNRVRASVRDRVTSSSA